MSRNGCAIHLPEAGASIALWACSPGHSGTSQNTQIATKMLVKAWMCLPLSLHRLRQSRHQIRWLCHGSPIRRLALSCRQSSYQHWPNLADSMRNAHVEIPLAHVLHLSERTHTHSVLLLNFSRATSTSSTRRGHCIQGLILKVMLVPYPRSKA